MLSMFKLELGETASLVHLIILGMTPLGGVGGGGVEDWVISRLTCTHIHHKLWFPFKFIICPFSKMHSYKYACEEDKFFDFRGKMVSL